MIQRLKQLRQSRFIRNVAVVATGTAGAQAITMAFSPLITRLYGPEAFGLLGTFMAILAVLSPMAALTYPIAIVLPKQDADAKGLAKLSMLLAVVISALALILILIWGDWFAALLGAEVISQYLWLLPFFLLFSALHQVMGQWLIRHRQFRVTARVAILQSALLNSAKVGAGLFLPLAGVLIILQTLASGLHALLLWSGIRSTRTQKADALKPASIKQLATKHRDFPLYRAPQDFINAASQSLPILMLASFFGPAAAGFYTLSKMVMGVPSTLIGKAVSDVFYPRITEAARDGENLTRHIIQATAALFAIGIIPFGLIMLFGPWFFSLVFGNEWEIAGEYAQWLALFFLFNFINKPSVAAVPVLGIQGGLLFYELFSTGGKVIGLVAGFYWFGSDILAVALFSVIGVIAYCAMMLWIISHSRRFEHNGKAS